MPAITNINRLKSKLEKLTDKYRSKGEDSVVVGYTANYAVYVHERPAKHAPGKQWKFLEQPARRLGGVLGGIIAKSLQGGAKLLQSLYLAGMRLQRESQQIVPVDTGNLRGSAFTVREEDLQSVTASSEEKLTKRIQKQKTQWAKKSSKQEAAYRRKKRERMKKYR
jgi:hypothetical protein